MLDVSSQRFRLSDSRSVNSQQAKGGLPDLKDVTSTSLAMDRHFEAFIRNVA